MGRVFFFVSYLRLDDSLVYVIKVGRTNFTANVNDDYLYTFLDALYMYSEGIANGAEIEKTHQAKHSRLQKEAS